MPKFCGYPPTARRRAAEARTARANKRAADLAPTIAELQAAGITTLRAIAAALNERNPAWDRRMDGRQAGRNIRPPENPRV
jgi:hypothetical protein